MPIEAIGETLPPPPSFEPPAPAEPPAFPPEKKIRRTRKRIESLKIDREKISARVKKFHDDDMQNRTDEMNARLQRYAKYRMWTEGKDWPWEGSSDVGLPDLMQHSLRVQDTLHNAVMSSALRWCHVIC